MFKHTEDFESLGYKKFEELTEDQLQERYDEIIMFWQKFLEQNDPDLLISNDYRVHRKNLFEIIRRCEERHLYFYIFHELEDINEFKDTALHCFWINTLKPFMVIKEDSNIYNCPNEMFSLYLILCVIEGAYKKIKGDEFEYPCDERIKDIIYDFKYCSLSREAMIAFVETLADSYGVGINYTLKGKEKQ